MMCSPVWLLSGAVLSRWPCKQVLILSSRHRSNVIFVNSCRGPAFGEEKKWQPSNPVIKEDHELKYPRWKNSRTHTEVLENTKIVTVWWNTFLNWAYGSIRSIFELNDWVYCPQIISNDTLTSSTSVYENNLLMNLSTIMSHANSQHDTKR